jgi:diaminopimelate epimerase
VGPGSASSRASMRVLNADGSEPEMCGNGLRCVALHLAIEGGESQQSFDVDTGAGTLRCEVSREDTRGTVRLGMGQAKRLDPLSIEVDGDNLQFDRVSTGNPHAIIFDSTDGFEAIDRIAPAVSKAIAGGSNVEFVRQLAPLRLSVVVWERGVGRTLACGTGAVASVVAAAARGRVPYETPVTVELPGGPLHIEVHESLVTSLEGPAERVFSGEINL